VVVAFSGGWTARISHTRHTGSSGSSPCRHWGKPFGPVQPARYGDAPGTRFRFAHETVRTAEMELQEYRDNPPNRCYFCKDTLFAQLLSLAKERGFATVVDGLNTDDLGDYRPGRRAATERASGARLWKAA